MEAAAAVDATAHCGLGKAFGFPSAPTGPAVSSAKETSENRKGRKAAKPNAPPQWLRV